jgi:MYXO-CTERM domain-containing protein
MKTGLTILLSTGALAVVLQGAARAQDCEPSRAMVILDKSSSMQTGTIDGVTKWDIATQALDTVVTEFETSLELGLMVFPNPDECSAGAVEVDPALGTAQSIRDVLATPPPTGGNYTPIAQTLAAAAQVPALSGGADVPRYAVLITDGWQWCDPYDAGTRLDAVGTIEDLNAAGVTTYVVGFGNAVDAVLLNKLAVAAGTDLPGCNPDGDAPDAADPCYYQADDPGELLGALMEIATSAAEETCDSVDNDCDGETDEELVQSCSATCGDGSSTAGTQVCSAGAFAECAPADPAACDDGGDDGAGDPPDQPAAEDDMDNGGMTAGCGCRSSSGGASAAGLLLLALTTLLVFRRQRAR